MNSETMSCPIEKHSQGENTIAIHLSDTESITYKQLNHHINSVIDMLGSKLDQHHIVAFSLSNPYLQLLLCWALFRINKIAFPLNPKFPKSKLNSICKEQKINIIITDQNINKYIPIQTPKEFLIITSTQKNHNLKLHTPSTIILTSGSSGNPKGAVHTLNHHLESAKASESILPISTSSCWYWNLPIHHVSGLSILFRVFLKKASLYIPKKNEAFIIKSKISHYSMVTTQLIDFLTEFKSSPQKNHNIKAILVGGSHIPRYLLEESLKIKLPIYTTYGMTETGSQITTTKCSRKTIDYTGKPLPHLNIKLINNEICVAGKSLCLGYLEKGVINKNITQNNWFHTGDNGIIEKGLLKIKGRKDKMFISGGENIYPEEIEQAILNTKLVIAVKIKTIEDKRFGFVPIALLKSKKPIAKISEEIITELKKVLPSYMIPKKYTKLIDTTTKII
tara:strand:- start:18614 stop:19963 length:1350 start_codon:yes stop_codon:yes gene_type:complete